MRPSWIRDAGVAFASARALPQRRHAVAAALWLAVVAPTCAGGQNSPAPCPAASQALQQARDLLAALPAATPPWGDPPDVEIWFRTGPVSLPEALHDKYPTDMSIVLQHQYENLVVTSANVSVTVYFKGVAENLAIPWTAVLMVLNKTTDVKVDLRPCRGA